MPTKPASLAPRPKEPSGQELSPAMEDYLEAILRLSDEARVARVRDIAKLVGVTRSTVSGALRSLADAGLVNHRPYEIATLTGKGREVAQRVNRRHGLLARFLKEILNVPHETADADACRLEHGLSRETVDRLVAFMEFLEDCPRAGTDWTCCFSNPGRETMRLEQCLDCTEDCVKAVRGKLLGKRRKGHGEEVGQ